MICAELLEITSAEKDRGKASARISKMRGCHISIVTGITGRLKKEILRETLRGWSDLMDRPPRHTAEPYGYRNRAQWRFAAGCRGDRIFLPRVR